MPVCWRASLDPKKEQAMKTFHKFAAAIAVVGALGAVTPAFAQSVFDGPTTMNGPSDQTGLTSLGIDISRAGGSPEAVAQFIAGLNYEAQRGVLHGCQTAIANPVSYSTGVLSFCQNAVGTGSSGGALGFAAETPMVAPAQPYQMPVLQPDTGEAY